jgi:hypothetical protein
LRLVLRQLSLVLIAPVAGPASSQPSVPKAGTPIGKAYSSRFQRAVETARLIGGKEPQATLDVTEGREAGKAVLVARVEIGQWMAA